MKTITLTQPWATLVAIGAKQIETRSWQTSYRGPLAIHAAKGFPVWARELCITAPFWEALSDLSPTDFGVPVEKWKQEMPALWECLPTGCIVAVCDMVDCIPTERVLVSHSLEQSAVSRTDGWLYINQGEKAFGDYSQGRFAWHLDKIRALSQPIPAKGALGLWESKESVL